jgi:citrate lyase beta subunit
MSDTRASAAESTAGADGLPRSQAEVSRRTAALRARLPLRYLRQQAHLTAPASDYRLAEKALGNSGAVAARLLDRHGIDHSQLAHTLGVSPQVVAQEIASPTPLVVIDIEDGVAPQMLPEARANAARVIRETPRGETLCFLRPAGVLEPRCAEDLQEILVQAGSGLAAEDYPLDGIVVPKLRHVHEVEWLYDLLATIESALGLEAGRIRVSYLIETGWGVLNLPQLVVAGIDRLAGLILGTVDLSADLLLPEVRYRHPICEWARDMIVAVAGSVGVPAIDGMTLDFPVARAELSAEQNRALLLERMQSNFRDALHSIDRGMSGRWVGHPLQLLATMLAFRSAFADEAIETQVGQLLRFSEAMASGSGAVVGASSELLDIGTDRHVRQLLRRATAWGLLPPSRARALGLLDSTEMESA